MSNKIKVAVLGGGPSSEREVSIKTANQVLRALRGSNKYEADLIEVGTDEGFVVSGETVPLDFLKKYDVIFIALHGKFGEDGRVQTMLDEIGVPYTGSDAAVSALAMNKEMTNDRVEKYDILTPKTLLVKDGASIEAETGYLLAQFDLPVVIKPNKSGSSVGVTIVRHKDQIAAALKSAYHEDDEVMIQEFLSGRELTCGVLGNANGDLTVLPVVEITPKNEFFDYDAKYNSKETLEVCPAQLPQDQANNVQAAAQKIHHVLGCDGLTRSDFILTQGGNLYFLEINTIPGMTPTSLCPKEAKAYGWSFSEFIDRIVQLALNKKR